MIASIVDIFFIIIPTLDLNWSSFSTKFQWKNSKEKSLKRKKFNQHNKKKNNPMKKIKMTKMNMNKIQLLKKFQMHLRFRNRNNKKNSNLNKKLSSKLSKVLRFNRIFQKLSFQSKEWEFNYKTCNL